MAGALKWANSHPEARTILVILPDSGSRYLSKVFDDEWLKANLFLDEKDRQGTVADLLAGKEQVLITAGPSDSVKDIIALMKKHGISQIPLVEGIELLGMITEVRLLHTILDHASDRPVKDLAEPSGVPVTPSTPIAKLSEIFSEGKIALVQEEGRATAVITKIDLIDYLARLNG